MATATEEKQTPHDLLAPETIEFYREAMDALDEAGACADGHDDAGGWLVGGVTVMFACLYSLSTPVAALTAPARRSFG